MLIKHRLHCSILVLAIIGSAGLSNSAHSADPLADLDNSDVNWEVTPLGRLMPSFSSESLTAVKTLYSDKQELLKLLADPDRFVVAHVRLCQLYRPDGANFTTVSGQEVAGDYFGLKVQLKYSDDPVSPSKQVEYPEDKFRQQRFRVKDQWDHRLNWQKIEPSTDDVSLKAKLKRTAEYLESEKPDAAGPISITPATLEYKVHNHQVYPVLPENIEQEIGRQLLSDRAAVLKALNDKDKLAAYHISLTRHLFYSDVVYSFDSKGQSLAYNGLTIRADKDFNTGLAVTSFPRIETEMHSIRLFWQRVFESIEK